MSTKTYDASKLQVYGSAAAGHDGVLSDESGAVVVKPCTEAEISFYESVNASHPDLAVHLPTFMGQLSVSADQSTTVDTGVIEAADGTVQRLHGKQLATDLHIVLANITHGFKKPNVLDLKLGAQLWDEAAKPEKRARLDAVSEKTTSSSLGFRIAGMRTWIGDNSPDIPADLKEFVDFDKETGYLVYNKMYGRKFSTEDIDKGFSEFILPEANLADDHVYLDRAREVLSYFLGEVKDIQKVFESKESRMYGASILLVYEGDLDEYNKTRTTLASMSSKQDDEGDDEDEDENLPKLAAVKMIDFAHATWHPGQGPDENAIRGMRSTVKILDKFLNDLEKKQGAK
ncbi:SAICAR synthase-like protein [Dothidotthia symphoricarpi CBS 119687]|uniref:Kinase n=1 Tax=Dothidotthia symphoricarpi CBS 119687 TaxID=1392245 RepID=A0A6A6AEL3_9PLEO|nr:SAICAR synthase-like protein [Dothidotthia symphoricarpi CBS 119687]KAF2129545.1 SAICAR synthase-like protein [Dothidotthia symphoricarpi CBS 119687]